jgi:hypothetical protein
MLLMLKVVTFNRSLSAAIPLTAPLSPSSLNAHLEAILAMGMVTRQLGCEAIFDEHIVGHVQVRYFEQFTRSNLP